MGMLAIFTKIIIVSSIAADCGLLLFVLLKKDKKLIFYFLIFHIIGILGWASAILLLLYVENHLAARLTFVFALIFLVSQYWFVKLFPENKLPKDVFSYALLLPTIFVFIVSFLPGSLFSEITLVDGYYIKVDTGGYSSLYSLVTTFYIFAPLFILYRKRKKFSFDRVLGQQLKFLFWGYCIFFITIWMTNYILPVYFNIYFFNGIGPAFSLIFTGFTFYIITRYRFLDIRLIVQRSLVYTALLALITSLYLLLVFVTGEILQRATDTAMILSAGLTAVAGIFGSRPVERYFTKVTDGIFFKDKYDYSHAIHELSEILNVNIGMEDLLKKITDRLKRIFKAEKIEIFLGQQNARFDGRKFEALSHQAPREMMDKLKHFHEIIVLAEIPFIIENRITSNKGLQAVLKKSYDYGMERGLAISVPILLKGKAIGMLYMGGKLSGDSYTNEDMSLLKTFSYQAAIALEKSRLYEAEKKYAGELEDKVKKRTEKIEKLQEEQKQMMIDISHGLQTPLVVVKGELEMLEAEMPENKNLKKFARSIDQISKFIYDMLNLARLETTQEDFKREKLDLSGLLEELCEYFGVLVQENGITITKDIEPDISVMGKKDKLEEAINNLVSNSIKYIDNEKTISISLKRNNGKARLVVADSGMGINKEYLPSLFNRFYRIKDGKHSGIKGTGIGLSIVKRIIEKHGGTIRAESLENKWTKMIVELDAV